MSTQPRLHQVPDLRLVVLTDLDGTLLDHQNYSHQAAQPALRKLRELGIPVIFNTSKTCEEVAGLRHDLDNTDPFVCENGSIIFIPRQGGDGYNSEVLGVSYVNILKVLARLRKQGFRFRGFNDMPASEVAALTGLSIDNAWLAKKRHGSEPLLWNQDESALADFRTALAEENLTLTKGGRFYHVMGQTDKASAVDFFRQYYAHVWQTEPIIVALGDGENDRCMLEAADYPIVIPGHSGTLALEHPATRTAPTKGPSGWNTSILALLQSLQKKE